MQAFDICKLHRFDTGKQVFEVPIYRNKSVHWMSLPARDILGNPLDGNDREIYRSLKSEFPGLKFCSAKQTHSTNIKQVDFDEEFYQIENCDGLVTNLDQTAIIIRTADCLPIFLFSDQQIGLLHAGHRGVLNNIIKEWHENFYQKPTYLILGDHIKHCCFQVHSDIYERFLNLGQLNNGAIRSINDTQWTISLSNILRNQWNGLKLANERFFDFSNCTCCNISNHSYRRSGGTLQQRLGHVIFKI